MSEKKVKRVVKSPKGLWLPNAEGAHVHVLQGETVEVSEHTAKSKAKHLYAPGEFEALEAAEAELKKAAEEEKAARKPEPPAAAQAAVASAKAKSEGGGSKGS